jgi:hypothetical protein
VTNIKNATSEVVTLEIAPVAAAPESKVPADLRKALAAAPLGRGNVVGHRAHCTSRMDSVDQLR